MQNLNQLKIMPASSSIEKMAAIGDIDTIEIRSMLEDLYDGGDVYYTESQLKNALNIAQEFNHNLDDDAFYGSYYDQVEKEYYANKL